MATKKQTPDEQVEELVEEGLPEEQAAITENAGPGLLVLIEQARAQDEQIAQKQAKVEAAQEALRATQAEAEAGWNAIFDELVKLEKVCGSSPTFKRSRLGRVMEFARQQRMIE
jgi:uncharacterized protein YlxW (UPF0749 family)